jgi:uncharacterized membrane protein
MSGVQATPLLTDPMAVVGFQCGVLALVFWLSSVAGLKKLFELTPPVIYIYFVPTLATTLGITPPSSPAYDWMTRYLLPFALFMLMISIDLGSIAKLGWMALLMMLAGTVGIVVGGPLSYLVFGSALPAEAWKGMAALSGSWIGGTANLVAIAESVGTPDSVMGPIIVVDTVVGYGWMGVLLFLSAYQGRWDRRIGARTAAMVEANRRLEAVQQQRRPLELWHAAALIGLGLVAAVVCVNAGRRLPALGDPTIISATTWAVLMVVTAGLLLSFTRLRRLEEVGASKLGYVGLYLLLTGIGAQANLKAVLDAPLYLAAGALWIGIHAAILLLAARLLRAPMFFFATGSMANIGGAATAPVVAGVYHPAMAPVGLLMAVSGYVLGIYAGLLCAWLLGVLGG